MSAHPLLIAAYAINVISLGCSAYALLLTRRTRRRLDVIDRAFAVDASAFRRRRDAQLCREQRRVPRVMPPA